MTIDDSYLYDPGDPVDWEEYYGEKEDKEYQEWKDEGDHYHNGWY